MGESGLDFYYENSEKKSQITSFIKSYRVIYRIKYTYNCSLKKCRRSTFNILNEFKNTNIKILMHCYTVSLNLAKKLMKIETLFSASGIITFKNSIDLQETFKQIDINRILIETDSPFLAPVPMRGKKNEPSFY